MTKNTEVDKAINKAIWQLRENDPFLYYLVNHLKPVIKEECPTLGVNKEGVLYVNPKFFLGCSEAEQKGLLAHETWHLVMGHLKKVRRDEKSPKKWNIACDIIINALLKHKMNMELPEGGLICESDYTIEIPSKKGKPVKIDNLDTKSEDRVFGEVPEPDEDDDGDGKGDHDSWGEGGEEDSDGNSTDPDWSGIAVEASIFAKEQGKLSGAVERMINDLIKPKQNWKSMLWKYVTNFLPHDLTYKKPHRRSFQMGCYLPTVLKENLEMVATVDTSGSISQKEHKEFVSHIVSIARSFNNIKIHLVVIDAAIHETYEVTNGNIKKILALKFSGGGGTDHSEYLDKWVKKNVPNCRLVVHMTDAFTNFQNPPPKTYQTLWVISSNGCDLSEVPYGQKVKMIETE